MDDNLKTIAAANDNYDEGFEGVFDIRMLFTAMIERAFRDLMNGSYDECRSAMIWMDSGKQIADDCFTFKYVCEVLELKRFTLKKLDEAYKIAEKRRLSMKETSAKEQSKPGKFILDTYYVTRKNGRRYLQARAH